MLTALSRLCRALPLSWAMRLAAIVAALWYHLVPLRRRVVRQNIDRALGATVPAGRRRAIARASFTNACMYAVEALRMPDLTAARSAELVARVDMDRVDALLARGRGVIAVTAHIGNFDLLGTSQTVRGYPVHAIVKDIHWPPAQRFFDQIRAVTGLGTIAPRRSRPAIRALLAANQIVAFLIDQHMARHRAIVCSFFGQLAATTPAPVALALETGAPILPIVITRDRRPGHHTVRAMPEFVLERREAAPAEAVRHNTERLNRLLEGWVRTWPEQWLWQHRRWKVQDDPAGWDVPGELAHLTAVGAR